MLSLVWDAWIWLNGSVLTLVPGSVGAVILFNYWKWLRDRARADELRARSSAPVRLSAAPHVTIVATAWNEAPHIIAHLQSVRALRYPNKDYVLCAGGPDGTLQLARSHGEEWMTVLEQKADQGHHGALRRALSHATGEIVFLTDADCLLTDAAFEKTLEPLIQQNEVACTGGSEPLPEEKHSLFVLERWFINLYANSLKGAYDEGFLGCNTALKRETLPTTEVLGEDLKTGTDYYLSKMVLASGRRIRFVPESNVSTEYSQSLQHYCKRQSRWIITVAVYSWKFGRYREAVRCLRTPVVGLGMLAGAVIGAWQGGFILVCWFLLFLHAVLSRFRYIRFGELLSSVKYDGYLRLPFTVLLDFGVWAVSALAFFVPRRLLWQ